MTIDVPAMTATGEFERPPKPTELALLDIDRTLIKTRRLFETTLATMRGQIDGLSPELEVELDQAEKANKGNAFDYVDWLYQQTGDEKLLDAEVIVDMIAAANIDEDGHIREEYIDEILVDGSLELFEALEDTNTATVLLTAGGDVNQMVKVLLLQKIVRQRSETTGRRFVNLDSYVIIHNSKQHKTELANKCSALNEHFSIAPLIKEASLYGNIDDDMLSDVQMTWVVDDKRKNTAPTGNDAVAGAITYIDGDPDEREEGEEVDARPLRIGLRDVADMLQDRRRMGDPSLN